MHIYENKNCNAAIGVSHKRWLCARVWKYPWTHTVSYTRSLLFSCMMCGVFKILFWDRVDSSFLKQGETFCPRYPLMWLCCPAYGVLSPAWESGKSFTSINGKQHILTHWFRYILMSYLEETIKKWSLSCRELWCFTINNEKFGKLPCGVETQSSWYLVLCVCMQERGGNFFSLLLNFRYLFCVFGHAISHNLVYRPPVFKGNKYYGRVISKIKSVLLHWRSYKRLLQIKVVVVSP